MAPPIPIQVPRASLDCAQDGHHVLQEWPARLTSACRTSRRNQRVRVFAVILLVILLAGCASAHDDFSAAELFVEAVEQFCRTCRIWMAICF
jgi:hypothetical protein